MGTLSLECRIVILGIEKRTRNFSLVQIGLDIAPLLVVNFIGNIR